MKDSRYAIYQPLLKALAQAVIAQRPQDWTEGELRVRPQGGTVACVLWRHDEEEPLRALHPAVGEQAELLRQALQQDEIPWVLCRVGFYRKAVGWGVRVKITPSAGAPEVDLTPGRAAERGTTAEAQVPGAVARPGPPSLLQCSHCRVQALQLVNKADGMDYFRCRNCGYEMSMHATPSFDDTDIVITRPDARREPAAAVAGLVRDPDGRVRGSGFSVRLSSPETLIYQTDSGTVPVHISYEPDRSGKLEINRVTTMDTAFGSRMLTPREHQAIVQNLQSALPLLPGQLLLE
ncbi:MAG: hypothetical protein JOY84_05945 [Curvibacter sp.]|nr:hypothetical protein [Curvibacter sp.]